MKTLLLARHAKSDWNQPGYSDFNRPLNPRGVMDVPVMAKRIKNIISVEHIISSDAARALATATEYKNILTPDQSVIENHQLYNAALYDIADVVNHVPDQFSTVMIVGHNPGMTEIVNYYAANSINDMPTCSVAVIEFSDVEWENVTQNSGKLISFECPEK